VNDEIPNIRVIRSPECGTLPSFMSGSVIGIYADNFQIIEVFERHAFPGFERPPKHQMKKLVIRPRGGLVIHRCSAM